MVPNVVQQESGKSVRFSFYCTKTPDCISFHSEAGAGPLESVASACEPCICGWTAVCVSVQWERWNILKERVARQERGYYGPLCWRLWHPTGSHGPWLPCRARPICSTFTWQNTGIWWWMWMSEPSVLAHEGLRALTVIRDSGPQRVQNASGC